MIGRHGETIRLRKDNLPPLIRSSPLGTILILQRKLGGGARRPAPRGSLVIGTVTVQKGWGPLTVERDNVTVGPEL